MAFDPLAPPPRSHPPDGPPLHTRARQVAEQFNQDLLGALIVVADDGTILSWNDGAVALCGLSADETIGRSMFETIVPPEATEATRWWLSTTGESGLTTSEALRCRRDGARIWVDVSARSHRGEEGERLFVLNERDITRRRYRREAQALQVRFRGVLDAVPDAIVLVDASGRISLVNAETERLFGYGRDELLGEGVDILIPARFREGHPAHRARYFADPQIRPMGSGRELWGQRKDGSEFPVEVSLGPLTIDDSRLAMAAIRDVTARRRTEDALKLVNQELEAFTYSVSHDLRAPIRQIDGFSRLLAERLGEAIDAQVRHHIERIQEGTRSMGRLVDDLLHLARVGRQHLRPRVVALDDLVHNVVADLRPELGTRSIQWQIEQLPTVECDPGLMKVVYANLLGNAVKYTRPRSTAIIEVGRVGHNGTFALYVRDNGVGFDMKYADKLFGVFQRLHDAADFEGTGVGLATVQRIIRKHGGEIWAEAQPEHGATFYFTLGTPAEQAGVEGR